MTMLSTLLLLSTCVVAATAFGTKYVELKVVVDDLAFENWKRFSPDRSTETQFKEELNSVFYEAAQLYTSLQRSHMNIQFIIKELTLNAKNVLYNPDVTITSEGLDQFETWLGKQKKFEKTDYDVAILVTGYDIVSEETTKLYGYGRIGMVCTRRAVGMIELRSATYQTAFVMAHEIGHILGAEHDGARDNIGSNCKPDGHVMTSTTRREAEVHFKFSHCSYEYFYNKLASLPWECLDNGKASDVIKAKRLGTLMTADEACKRDVDKYAYVDRASYWIYGDEVCTDLWCDRGDGEKVNIFSPEGLYCGKNKQCSKGKCMESYQGRSDVSDDCPFGDQPKINYEGYSSCDSLPLEHCGVMKNICCKRCNIEQLGVPDRMCRKLTKNPKAQMNRRAYAKLGYGDTLCKWLACETGVKDKKTQWKWFSHTSNILCGSNKRCNGGKCLPTSDGISYLDDLCPYGDQPYVSKNTNTCPRMIESYDDVHRACLRNNYGTDCCAYCKGK